MKKFNLEKFKNILMMEQEELHFFLRGKLDEMYSMEDSYTDNENFIYVKGDIPVLLLAHLDTVHVEKPLDDEIFYDEKKQVMWSPVGIGGDDRCGVHSILRILENGYRPHVLFSWNEEVGCIGSRFFSDNAEKMFGRDFSEAISEINFAIQFDRKGFSESVYYDLESQDFENYINSFGFKTQIGSYTDICEVCPSFGFAGVNVSAGYLNEHTFRETIFVTEMLRSERKVQQILDDQKESPMYFKYEESPMNQKWYNYGGYGSYYDESDDLNFDYTSKDSYGFDIYPGSDDETYLGQARGKDSSEVCEYCFVEKSSGVPWDDTDHEILKHLCNECRHRYLEEKEVEEKFKDL